MEWGFLKFRKTAGFLLYRCGISMHLADFNFLFVKLKKLNRAAQFNRTVFQGGTSS